MWNHRCTATPQKFTFSFVKTPKKLDLLPIFYMKVLVAKMRCFLKKDPKKAIGAYSNYIGEAVTNATKDTNWTNEPFWNYIRDGSWHPKGKIKCITGRVIWLNYMVKNSQNIADRAFTTEKHKFSPFQMNNDWYITLQILQAGSCFKSKTKIADIKIEIKNFKLTWTMVEVLFIMQMHYSIYKIW